MKIFYLLVVAVLFSFSFVNAEQLVFEDFEDGDWTDSFDGVVSPPNVNLTSESGISGPSIGSVSSQMYGGYLGAAYDYMLESHGLENITDGDKYYIKYYTYYMPDINWTQIEYSAGGWKNFRALPPDGWPLMTMKYDLLPRYGEGKFLMTDSVYEAYNTGEYFDQRVPITTPSYEEWHLHEFFLTYDTVNGGYSWYIDEELVAGLPFDQHTIPSWPRNTGTPVTDVTGFRFAGGNGPPDNGTYYVDNIEIWEDFPVIIGEPCGNGICIASEVCPADCASPEPVSPYDLNGDGIVNFDDLFELARNYGTATTENDFSNDGRINIIDLLILINNFGEVEMPKFTKTALVYYGGGAHLVPGDEAWLGKYDILSIDRFRYDDINGDTWSAIKSVNPDIDIYLYQGARVANFADDHDVFFLNNIARYDNARGHSEGNLNTDNPNYFVLDINGEKIYTPTYSNVSANEYRYLMDFSNNDFSNYWIEATLTDITNQAWVADGVFGDNMGVFQDTDLSNEPVIFPDDNTWALGMNSHVTNVVQQFNNYNQKLFANRGHSREPLGLYYWSLVDNSPNPPGAIMEEGAFVFKWGAGDAQFISEDRWLRQVETLKAINNSDIVFLSHTDLGEGQIGTDNFGEQVEYYQLLWYALSSFQMGKKDNSYFMFFGDLGYSKNWWYEEYELDLGRSIGVYQVMDVNGFNIYYREFEEGYVFVNPNRFEVNNVPLPESLISLDHNNFMDYSLETPTNTINMPRYTGNYLVRP